MTHADRDAAPLRVAIVGVGPKGLFALERLLDQAHRAGSHALLDIDLFEPHPVPGAGPVYDPAQPGCLRMNFAADQLDLWGARSRAVPAEERRSFLDWRHDVGHHDDDGPLDEPYPSRGLVGRYLADGLACMRANAPAGVTITLRRAGVRAIERMDCTWTVIADGNAPPLAYDEVVVAVGHATLPDEGPAGHPWPHAAPLIPAVFPVTRWLAPARVAPGATIAVRGFALTFLDAAIALTEGRGGVFEAGDHPYRLRYAPSEHDPALILPFSRGGRPMLAKPDPALAAGIPALEEIARSGRAEILALRHSPTPIAGLVSIVANAAAGGLLAATGRARNGEALRRARAAAAEWLLAATGGGLPAADIAPVDEIERSLAVGTGLRSPDLQWALGHTWRSLYPAIVERLSGDGLAQHEWPEFRRLAAQMERVAFGPPPVNAAKLLALIAGGRVDLTHVAGAHLETRGAVTSLRSAHGERAVGVVLNAVLPQPGALRSDHGLLEQLVGAGHARIVAGRRGLHVTADAGCIGRDGRRTEGLSALGRPTEDCVIDNDTLSRTLHPHADRWARRVARRAARRRAPSERSPALPRGAP